MSTNSRRLDASVRDNRNARNTICSQRALLVLLFFSFVAAIAAGTDVLQGERYPQTRQRVLGLDDVKDMSLDQIRYAINEVYARRGAPFHGQQDIQRQFQKFEWYHANPILTFDAIDQMMTEAEKRNVKLLAYVRDLKRSGLAIQPESTPVDKASPLPTAETEAASTPVASDHHGARFRWHIYSDQSVLLDDDDNGQRLVLPSEYHEASRAACEHYAEVNPDSYTDYGTDSSGEHPFAITLDVTPRHVLTNKELESWLESERVKSGNEWWWYDLLIMCYRDLEKKAQFHSAQDPERAREEATINRQTARIPEPSASVIRQLAAHRIQFSGKSYHLDGSRAWFFTVKDPNPASGSEIGFPVPAGSSLETIIATARQSAGNQSTWVP